MEERDLNCSEEKSYCLTMGDFATKVTKIQNLGDTGIIKAANPLRISGL
jgi:hypothetical protein